MNRQQETEKSLMQRFDRNDVTCAIFQKRRVLARDPQFLDVKHMAELVVRYREQTRLALRAARMVRALRATQNDPIETVFLGYEAAVLDRRLGDCLQLWYIAHKDYHLMRRTYLDICFGRNLKRRWDEAA